MRGEAAAEVSGGAMSDTEGIVIGDAPAGQLVRAVTCHDSFASDRALCLMGLTNPMSPWHLPPTPGQGVAITTLPRSLSPTEPQALGGFGGGLGGDQGRGAAAGQCRACADEV